MGPVHYFSVLLLLAPTVGLAQQCHAVRPTNSPIPDHRLSPALDFGYPYLFGHERAGIFF